MAKRKKKIKVDEKQIVTINTIIIDFLIVLVVLLIIFYIHKDFSYSVKNSIPYGILIIYSGMVFEYKQITNDWEKVILTSIGALLISVIAFLPGKNENKYDLYFHLSYWTYWYVISFVGIALYYHRKKTIPKLTEGITLIQSIAIIYWIMDVGNILEHSPFVSILIIFGLISSLFSIYNAFSYRELTKNTRLTLSIWSAIVMMIFGFEFIYKVLKFEQINDAQGIIEVVVFSVQNFLLGISIIYILQNFVLVFDFLPDESRQLVYKSKNELKKEHLKRYSDKQVKINHSIIIFIFTSLFFITNFFYRLIPRNMAIWITFIFFPYIIEVFELIKYKVNKKQTTANTGNRCTSDTKQ